MRFIRKEKHGNPCFWNYTDDMVYLPIGRILLTFTGRQEATMQEK